MKIVKLKNGAMVTAENMSFKTNHDVEWETVLEFEEDDAKGIRENPFAYKFEFDDEGQLSKVKKGNKNIHPRRTQNI